MKLRNKKTGEIGYPYFQNWKEITCVIVDENAIQIAEYTSLAELNKEWEDYEEPKKHYEILAMGVVMERKDAEDEIFRNQGQIDIGNYFETEEEAEKAVEKLKAWKRLKDKGFRFIDHTDFDDGNITIWGKFNKELDEQDVNLLFGGEE